jgi:hypothetical protein
MLTFIHPTTQLSYIGGILSVYDPDLGSYVD